MRESSLLDYAAAFVSPGSRERRGLAYCRLYGFAAELGATIVKTSLSRSIIDVNRDPSGASLYPGQATTELCPTDDFRRRGALSDGEGARRSGGRRARDDSISRPITTR